MNTRLLEIPLRAVQIIMLSDCQTLVALWPLLLIRILKSRLKPPPNYRKLLYKWEFLLLTVECPNVTLCYKVKMTFLNPKFNQIRKEIVNFWLLFGL